LTLNLGGLIASRKFKSQAVWELLSKRDGVSQYGWRAFVIKGKGGNWTLYRDGQQIESAKYRVDLERRASKLRNQESAASREERDAADDGIRTRQPVTQRPSSIVSGGLPGTKRR
jgi:hypothetical protein